MIFRIASDGTSLTVEDEEGVMFTLSIGGADEAHALIRKARDEGIEAIRATSCHSGSRRSRTAGNAKPRRRYLQRRRHSHQFQG